tara:strand:+ start:4358 stop:5299 length:942 start_codon:yes stop_codon:yes gene_type:complete
MEKKEKKYFYSEIFNSIQGEGLYTGVHTFWLRFFLCNLQCDGFGQDHPTKPDTWELPYQDFDPKTVNRVEDLPVWEKGCDSSYTWSKKFRHLMGHKTAKEIYQQIFETTKTESNPEGGFVHPVSGQRAHLCYTGGEPLMKHAQQAVVEINEEMRGHSNKRPARITFETNGTQELTDDFKNSVMNNGVWQAPVFFSVSPKLWSVAGEKREKAIQPKIVADYNLVGLNANKNSDSHIGQLKFVMGPHKEQWEEMEEVLAMFRAEKINWPVYIMPVGATVEEQERGAGEVAKIAFERGYNVSGRLHCYLFGNAIGT